MANHTTSRGSERVLVGIDGSECSMRALDWAASKTATFGPVTALLAFSREPQIDGPTGSGLSGDLARLLRDEATVLLDRSLAHHPELRDRARVVEGRAGPCLIEASADFDLLVVGSRGRSTLTETLLGSIGSYCVKRARIPVAVVTDQTDISSTIDEIVVGVDGSANSLAALRWAVDHVTPGGRIRAVDCGPSPSHVLDPTESEAVTADHLWEAIGRVVEVDGAGEGAAGEGAAGEGAEASAATIIEPWIEQGDARQVLGRLGREADLLVVGARGRQGLRHLVLGSVATALLHHPTATTVVVPAPDPSEGSAGA